MPTGDYWNEDDPLKPWGLFDKDEVKHIPFDFSAWLAQEDTTYVTQDFDPDENLTATFLLESGGVIVAEIKRAPAGELFENEKYGVTCLMTAADGQKKSQTLWFKIKEL